MSTLTIRIPLDCKAQLGEIAMRAGLMRTEDGELRGNISALILQLAKKTPDEVNRFLMKDQT